MAFFVGHSKLDDVDLALNEATSTFDNPDLVKTRNGIANINGITVQAILPKHSLNVLKILKK